MTAKNTIKISEELCKGCGLCELFCPQKIIKLDNKTNRFGYHPALITDEDKCSGCGFCFLMCPDIAIQVERRKKNE